MSIHRIKEVIKLAPDSYELIKQAKVEREFPTDCKDSVLATALEIEYMVKIAHEAVPDEVMTKVAKAVDLYDLSEDVKSFTKTMVKQASHNQAVQVGPKVQDEVNEAVAYFETGLSGMLDIEKTASVAENLYDNYEDHIDSEAVEVYAGAGVLNKEAALKALNARHAKSGNREFIKVAKVIQNTNVDTLTVDDNRTIASCITDLEKSAGIYCHGFNFYKEAFMSKQASVSALQVKLDKTDVPVENILQLGHDKIAHYLGADIQEAMGDDPQSVKSIAESLPLPQQQMLCRMVGHVG